MANPDHVAILYRGVPAWNQWRREHPGVEPDLSRIRLTPEETGDTEIWSSSLRRADLSEADMRGVNLYFSNIVGVVFHKARFEGANLRGSTLNDLECSEAVFDRATLANVTLHHCELTEARFCGCALSGARFERIKADRADFSKSNMVGATMINVDLRYALMRKAGIIRGIMEDVQLGQADLYGTDLRELKTRSCNLRGANLEEADLEAGMLEDTVLVTACMRKCNLRGTVLRKCQCRRADFTDSNMRAADIRGADLRSADLRDCNVVGLVYDRWARYQGIRLDGCFGSPQFMRFAKDQEFIEEVRGTHDNARWWFLYLPWLVSSDCGRSLALWAGWSVLLALGFGYRYWSMGPEHFEISHLSWSLSSLFYFSIVTFTTLGYGDILPKTDSGAFWVTLEVIMGYIMLGGIIAIFSNKLARRSG